MKWAYITSVTFYIASTYLNTFTYIKKNANSNETSKLLKSIKSYLIKKKTHQNPLIYY